MTQSIVTEYPPAFYLPYIDDVTSYCVEQSGIPFDQVLILLLQAGTHLLGFCYRFIPNVSMRHYFGLLFGLPFQFIMYREKILIWWIPCIISYFLIKFLKQKSPLPVILFLFSVLLSQHYFMFTYRYLSYEFDVSIELMIGGMKIVSFAFCVADGFKTNPELDQFTQNITQSSKGRRFILKEITERKIHKEKFPSFFNYFSYLNNFQTGVIGPYIDYNEFQNWIERKGCYANIPFTVKPLIKRLLYTGIFGYLYAVIYPSFRSDQILTEEWQQRTLFNKLILTYIIGFLLRTRFHFGWNWVQISNITTGIAYGKDEKGEDRWDFINMQDSAVELLFGFTFKNRVDKWNIQCTKFFRRYTYNRLRQIFSQFVSLLLVFFINSLWHGFYISYWLISPSLALSIEAAKCCYRFWSNKVKGSKYISNVEITTFSGVFQLLLVNLAFLITDFKELHKLKIYLGSVYYLPYLLPISVIAFFKITGYGQISVSLQENRKKKEK